MDSSRAQLEKVKHISIKIKDCINGYIRPIQHQLSNNNSYVTIPSLVIQWLILYYHIFEQFDPKFCHDSYELSENDTKITKSRYGHGRAYLTKVVREGVHKWRFKLINVSASDLTIGVWKAHHNKSVKGKLLNGYAKRQYYGWWTDYVRITYGDTNDNAYYGDRGCQAGDTIEMILDLDALQLKYNLNENPQGVAFDEVEKCEYCVGISMLTKGNSIQLLSYDDHIQIEGNESGYPIQ